MNELEGILARSAEILQAADPNANVYDFTPYGNTEAALNAIMLDDSPPPMIHFWAITREATPSKDESIPAVMDFHKIVFRGWYGLTGDGKESSRAFTKLIEMIRCVFRSNRSLKTPDGNGDDPKVFFCGPMQVRVQMTGSFAGRLVHYTEITMEAQAFPIDYNNSP